MTTIKAILNAKASGDDSLYRGQLSTALMNAYDLEKAEATLATERKTFSKSADVIKDLTGCELWHTDAKSGAWFWQKGKETSVTYPTRHAAIEALIADSIKWQ